MRTAIRQVDKLTRANTVNQRVISRLRQAIIALCVVAVIVLASCAVLGYVAVDQHRTDAQLRAANQQLMQQNDKLRQEAITSCAGGNDYRQGQTEIWTDFIGLLISKKTPKATVHIADAFLARVKKIDTLHDCAAQYRPGQ